MSQDEVIRRIDCFKNKGKNSEEMRRKRNDMSIELRKARKDDQLLKKRNIVLDETLGEEELSLIEPTSPAKILDPIKIKEGIQSGERDKVLRAVQSCRKILSRQKNPPIDTMINSGLVPLLVELLDFSNDIDVEILFEAAWALTNIASGNSEQTRTVIEAGGVPKFAKLLSSPHAHIVEQAVWALGNIAGDGPDARDMVLSYGVMKSLIRFLNVGTSIGESFVRNVVWTVSNLCRNKKPPPNFEIVKHCIPCLARLLHLQDADILADVCWAFSYLTDGTNEKIQTVVEQNVVPRLVELLGSRNTTVVAPTLRVIGNIVTGNDEQTDTVLQANVLPKLKMLLHSVKNNLVKEAAWTLSNLTAGTSEQIQKVIDADIIPDIIEVMATGDMKAQREAAWAVTNFTSGCTVFQLYTLLKLEVLPHFCNLLGCLDAKTICVVLDGILNMLQTAEKVNEHGNVALAIEECGGLDKIEELQNHDSEHVYCKAYHLIESYFSNVENDDGDIPESTTDKAFAFSAPDKTTTTFTF